MGEQIIRQYYQAFNDQDFNQMLGLLDEGVVHELNEGPPQVGLDEFIKFMSDMDLHYSEKVEDLMVFTCADKSRYATEFYINGLYKKTHGSLPSARNQKYRIRVGAFFEIRGEKITRVTNYYNLQEWIKLVK